jgi:lipoate-protein ligase A
MVPCHRQKRANLLIAKAFLSFYPTMIMVFVYFGHETANAFRNMAIDHTMVEMADKTEGSFARIYDFTRPAFILAYRQHPSDIYQENCSDFDVTRRLSQGGVILCDKNTLCYSVAVPKSEYAGINNMHEVFGNRVANAIRHHVSGVTVHTGRHYSVRIDGRIVVGNGQRALRSSILYHGTIAVMPWDVESISKVVKMSGEERRFVENLPCLKDFSPSIEKDKLSGSILSSITCNDHREASEDEKRELEKRVIELEERFYRNPHWVELGPYHDSSRPIEDERFYANRLLKNWGFCFADVKSPEPLT